MDENFVFKGTHVSYNKRSVMKLLTLNAPEEASYIMGSFEVLLNKLSNSQICLGFLVHLTKKRESLFFCRPAASIQCLSYVLCLESVLCDKMINFVLFPRSFSQFIVRYDDFIQYSPHSTKSNDRYIQISWIFVYQSNLISYLFPVTID